MTTNPPSSGTKRACTAPGGRAASRSAGGSSTCSRDWANLGGEGPGGLIADLALASDVADYVRFRAVCRSWRRCSPDPRAAGLDGRFLPRRWIKLDDNALVGPRRHRFLNVSTGECIRLDLPELAEHRLLALSPEGLLLLLHEPTLVVRPLNPLTRQLTDLPPVIALLQAAKGHESARSLVAYGVAVVAEASTVCLSSRVAIAVTKPGDKSWAVVNDRHMYTNKGVMVLDITSDQQAPRLVVVGDQKLFRSSYRAHSLHLVDNGGELLLVHRTIGWDRGNCNRKKYEVYRVDLDDGTMIRCKGLNGRAVFMGTRRAISVSAGVFPGVAADTIYLGFDCDGQILGHNVADGSRVPRQCSQIHGRVCLDSIVNCLCNCIQGIGDRLA